MNPPLLLAALAGRDGTKVAVPLMLSAAGHAKGDIPAALARERTRHPGLSWIYGRPLGPHPVLLDLLARLLWEGRAYPFTETASGVLPDRVVSQTEQFAAAHPELDVRCTDVLGDCDEIVGLVYERYHEALAGDIRMSCDMCVHRIAMPGFEHRVGEPQHPHHHPHDPGNHAYAHD